jgi:spore coat polysaccharide biosynthesis protein SpsF
LKIIAVVELDRWIRQFDLDENKKLITTALARIVELYKQCHAVDEWVFSLTYNPCYSSWTEDFSDLGVELQAQQETDPLNSFYQLVNLTDLHSNHPNHKLAVIRLLANVSDPECFLIDAMVTNHIERAHHYSRNQPAQTNHDIEIMNFTVLHEAWQEALLPDDRDQITPYIYRQQQRFNLGLYPYTANTTLHA